MPPTSFRGCPQAACLGGFKLDFTHFSEKLNRINKLCEMDNLA